MAKNISESEFLEIYQKYKNLLYRIAFTYLKNNDDTADILQEVFIRRIYKAPNFESDEHEKRWLIRVTVNLCKNHIKFTLNGLKIQLSNFDKGCEYWELDNQEQSVYNEIMQLLPKHRIVIFLHYYEGYSCKEISEILNCGESAVKMRLKKARELLKEELEV